MNTDDKAQLTSWRFAITSAASSCIALGLHVLYGHVHWSILQRNYQNMVESERERWLSVLNGLEWYRLAGLLAIILAVLALRRNPRWPALVYVPLAVLAGLASLIIM
jgi:hypothetical protein